MFLIRKININHKAQRKIKIQTDMQAMNQFHKVILLGRQRKIDSRLPTYKWVNHLN